MNRMTGHCPPLCRGMTGFFFEDPAEVVCTRKSAQAGDDIEGVFPVEEKPHGSFDPDSRQIASGRNADCRREGADKMALGDAETLAQFLDAVQTGIVFPDVCDGFCDQRRKRWRGTVGSGKLAEKSKGELTPGAAPAVRIALCGKLSHQLGSGWTGLAPGKKRQLGQPGKKLLGSLPRQLDAEDMAFVFGRESQRRPA